MTDESSNIHSDTVEDRLMIRDWLKEEPFTLDKFEELGKEISAIIEEENSDKNSAGQAEHGRAAPRKKTDLYLSTD